VGIAKSLYVGTNLNYGGVTLTSAVTGTGKMVLDTSPTLVTPALGTPASGVLTNCTGVQYTGFKNRIINGAMVIDQRNAGAGVTVNTSPTFVTDRWNVYSDLANATASQNQATTPVGFSYVLKYLVGTGASPTSGQISRILQSIEGYNVADLMWGGANAVTVTLSFWVNCSVTGTHSGSLANYTANRSYPFTFTVSSANTWEYKSITIAGDQSGTWLNTNGIGLKVQFNTGTGSTYLGTTGAWAGANYFGATGSVQLAATTGATLYITGVQLEKSSTATSFDYRPYGTELQLCQRYYEIGSFVSMTSIGNPYATVPFKVTKRAAAASTTVTNSRSLTLAIINDAASSGYATAIYQNSNDSSANITYFTASTEL
jgi:hypothetical protein